jgi:threonine dehydratase
VSAFSELVRTTPLVPSAIGHLKLESLQRTGSFKLRGACLRLDALSPDERRRGVVAASAGNHGLGVALAGRALEIPVEVVVPATSPGVKRRGIEALGAKVTDGGPTYDDAERAARVLASATDRTFVSAFDDPLVIRGNGGTLGEEILKQHPDVKTIVLPVGGGGMIGGLAAVVAPAGVNVVGIQPEVNCAMHRSLELGRALTVYEEGGPTIAEGCEGAVAESTFALCRTFGVEIRLVSEAQIRAAIAFAYTRLGLLVEPTAAVAIAGALDQSVENGVIIVSGGNVEPELVDRCLKAAGGNIR